MRFLTLILSLLCVSASAKFTPEELNDWKLKAEQGDAEAQCRLGLCYSSGDGVTEDKTEAVKWYRKAAEKGNARALFNLGYSYQEGSGVIKDGAESIKWFHKAAAQGDVQGLFMLGCNYEDGYGLIKNPVEAYAYFNIAGITSKVAGERRDRLARKMTPSQIEAGVNRSKELQAEVEDMKKSKWWQITK